jgi:hypothetical protein
MSDMKKDDLFVCLIKLLNQSNSVEVRLRIIKSMPAPYTEMALAFMGTRLRDINPDVPILIFK